ncbi:MULTISPECIES: hypothetical protein [Vibrio harveyi group]|nr:MULTISPECIES: hypothetical protein [Vibrio harveyi group]ELY5143069.1 hypothetical protein [Vibrio vulnificus]EHE7895473.1 hypothetical protein [Vibrio parahaemolyticus]EIO5095948.1 hypothetical protein [Vibrio parahaemolyticus]EKI0733639.1 hypothetical protein [Vibrio parahaemolyticus]EKO3870332.1 hypothetical protein [Vibrio harveyi]
MVRLISSLMQRCTDHRIRVLMTLVVIGLFGCSSSSGTEALASITDKQMQTEDNVAALTLQQNILSDKLELMEKRINSVNNLLLDQKVFSK